MRKLYPFGWIDRDLKELGFLSDMSASASKLYILYVLAGGSTGKSCYGIEALKAATGLSGPTIYKARQELVNMGLITTRKEMVRGHKNKKPKIWVELQDLPVDSISLKRRRAPLSLRALQRRSDRGRNVRGSAASSASSQSQNRVEPPAWITQAAEQLRRKRECSA